MNKPSGMIDVYIDTSAYSARRHPPELGAYMKTSGKKKVIFGTKNPMIPPAQCLENLADLNLDEKATALFLFENAARVFGLATPKSG